MYCQFIGASSDFVRGECPKCGAAASYRRIEEKLESYKREREALKKERIENENILRKHDEIITSRCKGIFLIALGAFLVPLLAFSAIKCISGTDSIAEIVFIVVFYAFLTASCATGFYDLWKWYHQCGRAGKISLSIYATLVAIAGGIWAHLISSWRH
jgi:hypothetical protein